MEWGVYKHHLILYSSSFLFLHTLYSQSSALYTSYTLSPTNLIPHKYPMSSSACYNPAYFLDTPAPQSQSQSTTKPTQTPSNPATSTMPTGGVNNTPYGPGLFVTNQKPSSSIFDSLFKSKSKATANAKAEALLSDKASVSTSSTASTRQPSVSEGS